MIDPKDVMLCISFHKDKAIVRVSVYSPERYESMIKHPIRVIGAGQKDWAQITDSQRFGRLLSAILDLVEFHGLPLRYGRDCLADGVEGYREWVQGR